MGITARRLSLLLDTAKGNRPSYEAFCAELAAQGVALARGVFGARMVVELENDGPVTIVLDV